MKTPQQHTGAQGENAARQYLETKGYRILHENWRKGQYEIDLIARFAQLLIFVEVKTRSYNPLVEPYKAVTRSKQQSLLTAAKSYVTITECTDEIRFDVVTVIAKGAENQIEHIEDAFRAYVGR
ncbi:MAG: YraN family protein [Bacteroidota bacterium]